MYFIHKFDYNSELIERRGSILVNLYACSLERLQVGNVWHWSIPSILSLSPLTHSVFPYVMQEMSY